MIKSRVVKSVSFTKQEFYLLKHAENSGNFSHFIKELLKEDFRRKSKTSIKKEDELKNMLTEIKNQLQNQNSNNVTKNKNKY